MAMPKNEWSDISVEAWREYVYSDHVLRIEFPVRLHVSPSSLGGHAHRIETAARVAYYVAPGWKAIRWQTADGEPLFKF